jgi:hypothetical protein
VWRRQANLGIIDVFNIPALFACQWIYLADFSEEKIDLDLLASTSLLAATPFQPQ